MKSPTANFSDDPQELDSDGKTDGRVLHRLSSLSKLYDVEDNGFLCKTQQKLRDLDVDGNGQLSPAEIMPFVRQHNQIREDNRDLRRNQIWLGITTALFAIASMVMMGVLINTSKDMTIVAINDSVDTVVSSDGTLANKITGNTVVTQSKGVSIVSELQDNEPFDLQHPPNGCVRMEDVATIYKAFGQGTDIRILTNDSATSGLNDGEITFPVKKVQGDTAGVNDTHVLIGDASFDIAADNPCNRGRRKYPHGPRKLFHDHLHGRHLQSLTPAEPAGDTILYDAVIIGAGWSGISAASKLLKEGVEKILILEGRDYFGGRSRTVTGFATEAKEIPFEHGSEFIYTSYENDILDIFNKKDVSTKVADLSSALFFAPGVEEGETSTAEKMEDIWFNGFVRYVQRQNLNDSSEYQTLLAKYEAQEYLTDTEKQILNSKINFNLVIEYGQDAGLISAKGTESWLTEASTAVLSVTSVKGGGYARAIESIVEEYNLTEKTIFGANVNTVNYENDFVTIDYVEDERDKIVTARTVLVTAPLGVLKAGDITFSPPLPSYKQDAIDVLDTGVLDKVIMYWDDETMSTSPIFKEKWDEAQESTWFELVTPEINTSNIWTAFFNSRRHNGVHTMTSWIGGTPAMEMELMSDEDILEDVCSNLKLMFGPDVPAPTKHIITRWGTDKYSRGSYSYRSLDVDFEDVAERLSRTVADKVFFSGEHTSISGWAGTAVGAFETGELSARAMERMLSNDVLVSLAYN